MQAQTDLTAYLMRTEHKRASAELRSTAGTWQEDADRLTTWYSGCYNGLAKKHYFNIARSKGVEAGSLFITSAS